MGKAADRRLWTGSPGASWIDPIREDWGPSTWIMPTPLARDRLARRLLLAKSHSKQPTGIDRVFCWVDLWRDLRSDGPEGLISLSSTGARAALLEAIDRARLAGELTVSASVAESAGFRRRIARRIAPWMAAGRAPEDLPTPIGAVEVELRRIYRHYQEVLSALKGFDEAGLEAYSSALFSLTKELPLGWGKVDRLVLVEPPGEDRPVRLAMDALRKSVRQLGVVLTFDGDPAHLEVDAPAARFRERLLSWGFLEERLPISDDRPSGLVALSRALFREDASGSNQDQIDQAEGLSLRGASTGEGLARVSAVWARERLARGEPPEELLILVRSWNEQANATVETLRAWGLPIATGRGPAVASDAAVQALRLAMNVPVEDWDTELLGRLLRNGRLRPDWVEANASPMALAATAAALREARVYRGHHAIAEALDRMAAADTPDPDAAGKPDYHRRHRQRRSWLGGIARPIFGRLSTLLNSVARPGPWNEQLERLAWLALGLGLDPDSESGLGHLFAALDDHGLVLDRLGRGQNSRSWAEFVSEVESILRDLPLPRSRRRGPSD